MKIDHINIAAPMNVLTEVRDFYCHALGLEDGPRPNFGFRGYWLYGDGKPIVHLMESDNRHATKGPHFLDHVAFNMENLESYVQRLRAQGVIYKVNYISDFNISQVFCEDPCGNGVQANFPGERL